MIITDGQPKKDGKTNMEEKDIEARAAKVADVLDGLELMEAVDVIGTASNMSVKKGNDTHALINIYAIAKMVESVKGRQGIVQINDDGTVSYIIKAHGEVKKYF